MSWLAWAGILIRFLYIFSGLKGIVERYRSRQEGRKDEQLERTTDAIKDAEDAKRTRIRVDSDDDYYDKLWHRYKRD